MIATTAAMTKDEKKSNKKSASFAALSTEDKLDRLYSTICSESGNVRKKLDDLSATLTTVTTRVNETEDRVNKIDNNVSTLQAEICKLKIAVNEMKQSQFDKDILMRGVPEIENNTDDLSQLVQQIFQIIGVPVSTLQFAKRIGSSSDERKQPRIILLQARSREEKMDILKKKRKIKLSCDQLMYNGQPIGNNKQAVYMDERLVQATADLFYAARMAKKSKQIVATWIRNGKVFIRKMIGADQILITTEAQLAEFTRKRRLSSTRMNPNENDEDDVEFSDFDEDIIYQDSKKQRDKTLLDLPAGNTRTRSSKKV